MTATPRWNANQYVPELRGLVPAYAATTRPVSIIAEVFGLVPVYRHVIEDHIEPQIDERDTTGFRREEG